MDALKGQQPQDAKLHFLDYWRIIRLRKTVILAVFLLVVITTTLVTFMLPEKFKSTARIKVDRDKSDISGIQGQALIGSSYDPYMIETESDVIKSEVILTNVITRLRAKASPEELRTNWWGTLPLQEAMETLRKGYLSVESVRNTSLIDITVYDRDKNNAARVANLVAEVYREYRVEEQRRLSSLGIDALTKRLEEVEKDFFTAQTNVDFLRMSLRSRTFSRSAMLQPSEA